MRWPGTIQPSRFLSHTGQVLPGVRRLIPVADPAAGADWTVTVPGGVQWKIIGGYAALTASATTADRLAYTYVTIDGYGVVYAYSTSAVVASTSGHYTITSDPAVVAAGINSDAQSLVYPSVYFPESTEIGTNTLNLEEGDQWSQIVLWIEEVYVTDPQLSEIAREEAILQRDIAVAEFEQYEQSQGAT